MTQAHTSTPFTADQRKLLAHMERNNISAFHCDPLRKWLWKSDIRNNAKLASIACAYLGPTVHE